MSRAPGTIPLDDPVGPSRNAGPDPAPARQRASMHAGHRGTHERWTRPGRLRSDQATFLDDCAQPVLGTCRRYPADPPASCAFLERARWPTGRPDARRLRRGVRRPEPLVPGCRVCCPPLAWATFGERRWRLIACGATAKEGHGNYPLDGRPPRPARRVPHRVPTPYERAGVVAGIGLVPGVRRPAAGLACGQKLIATARRPP